MTDHNIDQYKKDDIDQNGDQYLQRQKGNRGLVFVQDRRRRGDWMSALA